MRECGHVLEAGAEYSRRDPACILSDPAWLRGRAWIVKVGMETENAAASWSIGIVLVE